MKMTSQFRMLLIGALLLAGGSAWAQQFNFSTVALSGQPAPGTPAGVNYSGFTINPTLNAAGQSAFLASVTGAGVTGANDRGLWSGTPGGVALLAREGNPAPGTAAGVNYSTLGDLTLNAAGQSAFFAQVTGPGVTGANDFGFWSGTPGSVALLAREGDPAPSTAAGVNYLSFAIAPTLNAADQSAFFASITGPGVTLDNNLGLWSGALGSVALLARTGDHAPGTAAGVNYSGFFAPTLNAAGQSTFTGGVTGAGVTFANDVGLWSGAPGSVALLARAGDPAPGTAAGVNYSTLGTPTLNAAGQSAFTAQITGAGVTSANDTGLWSGAPGSVALLARAGDPAPGTAAGVNYATFFGAASSLNAAGQSAFNALVTGPGVTSANDSGLWSGTPGSLAKIVCEGEAAPGAGAGTLFGDAINSLALNDRGEVVFLNLLTGPGVTIANDGSLWFSDGASTLSLIVREGSLFEVAPSDTRTVSSLSFDGGSGDEDGFPCGFNDLGQVAFRAEFTDGSEGIFIATPALQLTAAVSRKMHGGLGPFDINLPITGPLGVECRSSGGIHTLVFSFTNNVVSGDATVTSGTGVAGSPTFAGDTMTVSLSGVADVQKITVTLSNVTDSFAQVLPDTAVSMNVLPGDVTANKTVSNTDVSAVKAQVSSPVTASNFRNDVNANGNVSNTDVSTTKAQVSTTLP